MIRRYNCDDPAQMAILCDMTQTSSLKPQALPRKTKYGAAPGLIPFGDMVDQLIQPADYKEKIAHCHEAQKFALYHQRASWGPPGFKWDQNGLGYCWTWSGTAALMDCMAREGKPVLLLSPVSMGRLVGWKNEGNYLESMIQWLKERGPCEMSFTPDMHSRDYRNYKPGWEENGLLYRLHEAYDADNSSKAKMIQHAISILNTGIGGYIAYNWWGHALELVGLRWDETQVNNLVWIIRNSHNEDDVIELTGNRGVPDELYGLRSSKTRFGVDMPPVEAQMAI